MYLDVCNWGVLDIESYENCTPDVCTWGIPGTELDEKPLNIIYYLFFEAIFWMKIISILEFIFNQCD